MSSREDLVALVRAALEESGKLDAIRQQLKPEVMETLSNKLPPKVNKTVVSGQKLLEDENSKLSLFLVLDFLKSLGLDQRGISPLAQLGLDNLALDRSRLSSELGLSTIGDDPLLFQVVKRASGGQIGDFQVSLTPKPPSPRNRSYLSSSPTSESSRVSSKSASAHMSKASPRSSSTNSPVKGDSSYIEESFESAYSAASTTPNSQSAPPVVTYRSPEEDITFVSANSSPSKSPSHTPQIQRGVKDIPVADSNNSSSPRNSPVAVDEWSTAPPLPTLVLEAPVLSPISVLLPMQAKSLDRRFSSEITRVPSLPYDDIDEIGPFATSPESKTVPEVGPVPGRSLDRRFKSGIDRLPSLPDDKDTIANTTVIDSDIPEESFMTESISVGSNMSASAKPSSPPNKQSPEVDDKDIEDDVPEESFLTDSFSGGGNSSADSIDLLESTTSLLRRKADVELSKIRTVAVGESKVEVESTSISRATVTRLGQARLSRSSAGMNSRRRRPGSPDSPDSSSSPERDDFEVQDFPDSPVDSKRQSPSPPGSKRTGESARGTMRSSTSTDVLESSTHLDGVSGSSDSDEDILQQSRQSNNREDEEEDKARITQLKPTSQGKDAKPVTQSKSMWTSGKESDEESDEFSAAESFDEDEDEDDGNIFDDDDEVPIAQQVEPKRDSAPTLSRTKSGTLAPISGRQQQIELSDDEEIEELDESVEEEDDEDEDEVVSRPASASDNKSLFTRVEPRNTSAQQASAAVEEDLGDEYEDDNFEEEDDEANITAYKNPGDVSGSASDDAFSVGEDSGIDDSVVSF